MGECRGCRWWDAASRTTRRRPDPDEPWQQWRRCLVDREGAPRYLGILIMYQPDAVYYPEDNMRGHLEGRTVMADLWTAPDFGCNQFAPREGTVSDGSPD